MSLPTINGITERQHRSLRRIVESLTSAQTRTQSCYNKVRKHDRKDFQDQILVCLPISTDPVPREDHPSIISAWAYNLSRGGVGFVALPQIAQYHVTIGIKRPDGTVRWLPGRIVRARPIPEEEFIDYGVAFQKQPANA